MVGLLDRLKKGLERTRRVLETPVEDLVRGRRVLDVADLDAIEEALIAADLGLPTVEQAMEILRRESARIAEGGVEAMRLVLRTEIERAVDRPLNVTPFSARPWVVVVVGVNGVGKTTTIGKLARAWQAERKATAMWDPLESTCRHASLSIL